MRKILVAGALGQIGSELTMGLREVYGVDNVIASSRSKKAGLEKVIESGPFEVVDITDGKRLHEVVKNNKIDTIINGYEHMPK